MYLSLKLRQLHFTLLLFALLRYLNLVAIRSMFYSLILCLLCCWCIALKYLQTRLRPLLTTTDVSTQQITELCGLETGACCSDQLRHRVQGGDTMMLTDNRMEHGDRGFVTVNCSASKFADIFAIG